MHLEEVVKRVFWMLSSQYKQTSVALLFKGNHLLAELLLGQDGALTKHIAGISSASATSICILYYRSLESFCRA